MSRRQRLLEAALEEFSVYGPAGARVDNISRRAGVNPQLITYYFGGKAGLYRETLRWCFGRTGELAPSYSLSGFLRNFFETVVSDPETTRLLQWEALDQSDGADDARSKRMQAMVEYLTAEQKAGRVSADLEPDLLALSLLAAAQYPSTFPQMTRFITGQRPSDPAFRERYARHLERLALMTQPADASNPSKRPPGAQAQE